jgi:FKBP-type peptidyl-prolyl cis-trans isomerase
LILVAWLFGCTPAPAPVAEEPPATGTILVPHAPPQRAIPDDRPVDPSLFVFRDDGLGVFDRVVGDGAEATDGVVAVAEITSWAPDGTRWDSTRERRDPARFVVGRGQVVTGWDLGVLGMRVGGVRQLHVPPALGFERGITGRLPAGSTVTQLELVAILVPPTTITSTVPTSTVGGYTVRDVRPGEGPVLQAGDTARIDWVLWLDDGTRIDDTFLRPAPFSYVHGRGLLLWEAAFDGMAVGGRREIELSPARAFGYAGRPPVVPGGRLLRLSVDLHAIE